MAPVIRSTFTELLINFPEEEPVVASCEHSDVSSGSIQGWEID
jgi:hypothetical protein